MLPVLFYGLERWIWKIMGHIFPPLILKVFRINKRNIFYTKQHPFLVVHFCHLSLCSLFLSPLSVLLSQIVTPLDHSAIPPHEHPRLDGRQRSVAIMRVEVYVFRGRDIPQVEDQSY